MEITYHTHEILLVKRNFPLRKGFIWWMRNVLRGMCCTYYRSEVKCIQCWHCSRNTNSLCVCVCVCLSVCVCVCLYFYRDIRLSVPSLLHCFLTLFQNRKTRATTMKNSMNSLFSMFLRIISFIISPLSLSNLF